MPLVDQIRVTSEHAAVEVLAREEAGAKAIYSRIQNVTTARRELLGSALLLTETMAPDAHDAAREALSLLGVDDDRVELFQSSGYGADTARLMLYGNPIGEDTSET